MLLLQSPDGASLKVLRSVLPTWLDADAQPPAFDPSLRNASAEAQLKQFNDALTQFLPYDWSASWDVS